MEITVFRRVRKIAKSNY